MTRAVRIAGAALLLTGMAATPARAQESQFTSDLRREADHVAESCGSVAPKALGGCAYTLISSYPFHVAIGSLAPGNGFAPGVALSERYTPNEAWRITWSGDAVRSFGGSYRAGAYAKFVHTPAGVGVVVSPAPGAGPRRVTLDTWALDAFVSTTSLQTIDFYGIGPDTAESARTTFGERQSMLGASVVLPMSGASWFGALRPAVLGGVTARWIAIRRGSDEDVPSIDDVFNDAGAPGLARQDAFVELREGIRFRPAAFNGRLRFDYVLSAQQFRTSAESRASFHRWTIDLRHQIPIYRGAASSGPPPDFNGPNECGKSAESLECPPVSRSRDRTGSIGVRLLVMTSGASPDQRVPFFLQPTLGGSDLNGSRLLASFADYRFRAPNLLALQETIEHSLWGPIGVFATVEQGTVAARAGDLGFGQLSRSYGAGLTVRAGGLPVITAGFAWGREGHHLLATVSDSLLGGGSRPSLY